MDITTEALFHLTARDVMSPGLVRIPHDMSLQAAAERLAEDDLRGAPVVDAEGRCVGVLSTTDFLHLVSKSKLCEAKPAQEGFFSPWQIIEPGDLPKESVANYMSRSVQSVSPETPIGKLARMMVDLHVHRLIVVEDAVRLIGIVSATDLLEALAKGAEAEVAAFA